MVEKACELMMANPDEPPSILSVCSRVGASRRKLNYCFQDVLGTSPTEHLRALRLNGVRRGLREARAGATVQDVAARWGFLAPGPVFTGLQEARFRAAVGDAGGGPEAKRLSDAVAVLM
jgi:transcriptional regulator GlxA family with amidase domain